MGKNNVVSSVRHMCADIKGLLNHYKRKKIKFMQHDNGVLMSDAEARQTLKLLLYEGKRVIPVGSCYRFDDIKGCKGHIKSIMPNEEKMKEIELEFKN